MLDAVEPSFIFATEDIVCCDEASVTDVTTVEDEIDDVSSCNCVVVKVVVVACNKVNSEY
jgi:hypothetical protein